MEKRPDPKDLKETFPDSVRENDEMSELRRLLVGPEQQELSRLRERFDNPELYAEEIGSILPGAISFRSLRDDKLTKALTPTVEEVLKESVEKNPQTLVDAIFPIMGPAIRKSIISTLLGMIQSFNEVLQHTFSWQGVKWRLESLRTGRSFGEIVLLHTLVYRVEQVFLIHRRTGLLLQHIALDHAQDADADMVSSMLTAIQDFVQDSLHVQKSEGIDTLRIGEMIVWLEQGPQAIIAAVIRGTPPQDFRMILQDTLETIHLHFSRSLEEFQGDVTPFELARPYLEECLRMQYRREEKKISPLLWVGAAAVIVGIGAWLISAMLGMYAWSDCVSKLEEQPGIVVTSAKVERGKYYIAGLRDPLAPDPNDILEKSGIDIEKVVGSWEPYLSMAPEFLEKRIHDLFQPPDTVSLELIGSTLFVSGEAPHEWILRIQHILPATIGVSGIEKSNLKDSDEIALLDAKKRIEENRVYFLLSDAELAGDGKSNIEQIISQIEELLGAASALDKTIHIDIVGHTSSEGTEVLNETLSSKRAENVYNILVARGFNHKLFTVSGAGSKKPVREEISEEDRNYNRCVTFHVTVDPLPAQEGS